MYSVLALTDTFVPPRFKVRGGHFARGWYGLETAVEHRQSARSLHRLLCWNQIITRPAAVNMRSTAPSTVQSFSLSRPATIGRSIRKRALGCRRAKCERADP